MPTLRRLLALGGLLLLLAAPQAAQSASYEPPEPTVEIEVPAVDGAASSAAAPPMPPAPSPQPGPPLRGSTKQLDTEQAEDNDGEERMRGQPKSSQDGKDQGKPHHGYEHTLPHLTPAQHQQLQQLQQLAAGLANTPTSQRVFRADKLVNCAWSPVLGPDKEKPFLPDLEISYNMQGFVFASNAPKAREARKHQHPHAAHAAEAASAVQAHMHHKEPTPAPTPLPFDQEEVYRIRAKYPYVRYFSFTTYDQRLQSVSTLHDTKIKPAAGKNPFLDQTTTEDEAGTYEIYITKDGRHGYPNEMAALRPNSTGVYGLLSMRLQHADPRPGKDRSGRNRDWGFVEMPVVELRNPRSGQFEPVRRCTEAMQAREEDFIEHLDVSFSKWWPRGLALGADCNATQFSLFDAERNPIIRRAVAVRNDEENYIFWCMPRAVLADKQYVVRITGLLPRTPYGLYDDLRVSEPWKYDARYVSFTAADAAPVYPSYHTLHDTAIRQHYTPSPTFEGWDGRYSIVAAVDPSMAQRCGLYDPNKDLLLKFSRKPLASPPHNPAIVMRQLLPSGGQVRSAGGAGREGVASVSLRNECVGPDGKLVCDPAAAARSQLHEFYPVVEVYVCKGMEEKHGRMHLEGKKKGEGEAPLTPVRIY